MSTALASRPAAAITAPSDTKRLLIVTHTGEIGGAEYVLLDVARHYGDHCDVLLFADGPLAGRLARLGIGHIVLSAGTGLTGVRREAGRLRAFAAVPSVLRTALRVARIARRYDVIYPNSQKAAVVTMLVARLIGRPLVWHMHDILSAEHFAPLQRWLVTRLANFGARRVIVVSRAARDSFVQNGGDASRAVVVHNGIDESRFVADEAFDAAGVKRELGTGDAPLVGLFGRISPWKGQHVLIAALRDLPGVHVLIVGEALFGGDAHAAELRSLAASCGVSDRVHWLGHRDDLARIMHAVDLVVHCSTSAEPFGRVIVEGMLAGRPVLAADHGASREVLGDDELSLVPPGEPALLAAAVRRMLGLPAAARAAIGRRNRARAQALFSLRSMLAGIEQAVDLDHAA